MEDILKLLLSEVQAIKDTVNSIEERLKRMEADNDESRSTNISDRQTNNVTDKVFDDWHNEETNSETPQDIGFELQEIWSKAIEIIRSELTEISFTTWIKSIIPRTINNRIINLAVSSQFNKGIIEQRYNALIKKAIYTVTGEEYRLEFSVDAMDDSKNNRMLQGSQPDQESRVLLNPNNTFDTLVVGEHNKLAYRSALEIAQSPGNNSRLLYIFGGHGLGKTHILQAIRNYIVKSQTIAKVMYISMDDFVNEMIRAIKDDSLQKFRNILLRNDVLIFDNLQNITGKERTQEEFHKIVGSILNEGKQVVIGCTKAPQDILIMDERFTALFDICAVFEISKPSLDTRIEILREKVADESSWINDEIIRTIANVVTSNVRELIGALNRVISYGRLTDKKVDVNVIGRILS